ncbi:PcfK-like protein [Dysgonomonas sp. 216]|uniref:PcfK-like family protein n=1 Tax=Dysgonomonas sp. 216 TaxID=2302934 RepID=UPI0013D44029|nr:PcfK-like family protein [Dysgonomonas sp. 216]NDW18784.1 PcfK-like protein [Dysgonomonas sp. 216]
MKSTAYFTRTILTYLEQQAEKDSLFAQSFAKESKNIDECCLYILNQVQKSGCNGFHDDEIFEMATDYYTKDNIEASKPINARITVNHIVKLTAEEIEEARKDAIQKAQNDAYNKMMQPKAKRVNMKQSTENQQLTLF